MEVERGEGEEGVPAAAAAANAIKSDKASMMIELPPVDTEQIPAWRVSPLTEVVACGLRLLK